MQEKAPRAVNTGARPTNKEFDMNKDTQQQPAPAKVNAALRALSKWYKDTSPPYPPRENGKAHCPDYSGTVGDTSLL